MASVEEPSGLRRRNPPVRREYTAASTRNQPAAFLVRHWIASRAESGSRGRRCCMPRRDAVSAATTSASEATAFCPWPRLKRPSTSLALEASVQLPPRAKSCKTTPCAAMASSQIPTWRANSVILARCASAARSEASLLKMRAFISFMRWLPEPTGVGPPAVTASVTLSEASGTGGAAAGATACTICAYVGCGGISRGAGSLSATAALKAALRSTRSAEVGTRASPSLARCTISKTAHAPRPIHTTSSMSPAAPSKSFRRSSVRSRPARFSTLSRTMGRAGRALRLASSTKTLSRPSKSFSSSTPSVAARASADDASGASTTATPAAVRGFLASGCVSGATSPTPRLAGAGSFTADSLDSDCLSLRPRGGVPSKAAKTPSMATPESGRHNADSYHPANTSRVSGTA
mmetsp:Transcript_14492/g.37462  ORF Transcript_14492/g.37462 Transcript_14492/m.37462 type:complete len:406 (-) Transcript_14492:8-1225(-)